MKTAEHTPVDIAEHLDSAADLIARHGYERGAYWTGPIAARWDGEQPVDVVGALALTYGIDRKRAVEEHFAGVPYFHAVTGEYVGEEMHPALVALMSDLGVTDLERLFEWSDAHDRDDIVSHLRAMAARLRSHSSAPAGRSSAAVDDVALHARLLAAGWADHGTRPGRACRRVPECTDLGRWSAAGDPNALACTEHALMLTVVSGGAR